MENSGPKISVLIPVYNAENYIDRCMESVLNQTYRNLEIIIVNDGSTDGSSAIIDRYAALDTRIVTIHKENGGIGSAYAVAFAKMTGNFVSFIDSDDYVSLDFYEDMVTLVNQHNPDIVHFGRVLFGDDNVMKHHVKRFNQILQGNDTILDHHFNHLRDPSLACRIFNRNLFAEIQVFNQNIGIDEMTIVQVLVKTNKVVFTDKVYYYTYERPDSVSRIEYSEQKIQQGIRVYQFICNFIRNFRPKYAHHTDIKYLNYLLPIYELAVVTKPGEAQILKTLKRDIDQYYRLTKRTAAYKNLPLLLRCKLNLLTSSKLLYTGFSSIIKLRRQLFANK